MTDKLPPQLLALFAPRPPLRWVGHVDEAPEKRKTAAITGLAEYLPAFNAYKNQDGFVPTESWLQERDRKKLEKTSQRESLLTDGPKGCAYIPLPCTTYPVVAQPLPSPHMRAS